MGYTLSKVQEIARKAKELQPKPDEKRELNKAEVIKTLAVEIDDLLKRGFSMEDVKQFLNGEGVDISSSTLKAYVYAQRSKSAGKAKKRKKTTVADASKPKAQTAVKPPSTQSKAPRKGTFEVKPDTDDI
jgi:IS30 family transposase